VRKALIFGLALFVALGASAQYDVPPTGSSIVGIIPSSKLAGVYSGVTGLGAQAQDFDLGGNELDNASRVADSANNLVSGFGCSVGLGSEYNILSGVGCTISTNSDNNFVLAVGQDLAGEIQRSVLLGGGGGWTDHDDVFNFNDSTSPITNGAVYFGCVNGFFIDGPYVLDDNVALQIEATADGMVDDKYNGVTLKGLNAGEAITQWDAVFFNVADSELHQADADAAGEFPCRGIAVATGTDGNELLVLAQGFIRNDGWTWTVGASIYLSDTAGELTQTAPSGSGDAVQLVGWATSVDEMYVNVSGHYITAP